MHVHIEVDAHGHASLPADLVGGGEQVLQRPTDPDPTSTASPRTTASAAWPPWSSPSTPRTRLGHAPLSSIEIAPGRRDATTTCSSRSARSIRSAARPRSTCARRLVEESGVRGFKFHPTVQGFDPSDEVHYPLYAAIEELGVPALFHTGQTGIGAGMPGGHGFGSGCRTRSCSTRRGGLPRAADHHGPPVRAMAGRGAVGRDPQAQHVDRPLRLEPQVLPAKLVRDANSSCKTACALRLRLPAADARPLDRATPSRPTSSPRSCRGS